MTAFTGGGRCMRENTSMTTTLELDDSAADAFPVYLDFAYSGELDGIDSASATALLHLADYLACPALDAAVPTSYTKYKKVFCISYLLFPRPSTNETWYEIQSTSNFLSVHVRAGKLPHNISNFYQCTSVEKNCVCELTPTLVSSDLRRGVENIVGRQISSTFRFLRVAWRLAC